MTVMLRELQDNSRTAMLFVHAIASGQVQLEEIDASGWHLLEGYLTSLHFGIGRLLDVSEERERGLTRGIVNVAWMMRLWAALVTATAEDRLSANPLDEVLACAPRPSQQPDCIVMPFRRPTGPGNGGDAA